MGTVTVKTSELIGDALDYAVAKCEGATDFDYDGMACWFLLRGKVYVLSSGTMAYSPSTNWAQGGPIIERESIDTFTEKKSYHDSWLASVARYQNAKKLVGWRIHQYGPAPLIAAMRCYVASKLGDAVQIPTELVP